MSNKSKYKQVAVADQIRLSIQAIEQSRAEISLVCTDDAELSVLDEWLSQARECLSGLGSDANVGTTQVAVVAERSEETKRSSLETLLSAVLMPFAAVYYAINYLWKGLISIAGHGAFPFPNSSLHVGSIIAILSCIPIKIYAVMMHTRPDGLLLIPVAIVIIGGILSCIDWSGNGRWYRE